MVKDSYPLAGAGPLSNGVPLPRGRAGESERSMPAPPKTSRKIDERDDVDDTVPMRRKP